MIVEGQPIERVIWWSAVLIAAGLGVELALSWSGHPLTFIAFLLVACPLVLAGVLLFLWSLVAARQRT